MKNCHNICPSAGLFSFRFCGKTDIFVDKNIKRKGNLNTLNEAPVYLPHSEQAYAPACRKVHV